MVLLLSFRRYLFAFYPPPLLSVLLFPGASLERETMGGELGGRRVETQILPGSRFEL
ncbi:hypothetical protein B0H10DRAFT_1981553 [Mycena sp. CBHHK59/15]|nr:hypothetical protein B0H10DRAFT_1981553 [Mycena sp. CBHHK59/15]